MISYKVDIGHGDGTYDVSQYDGDQYDRWLCTCATKELADKICEFLSKGRKP